MLISQLHPITSDIVSTGGRKGKVITQLKLSHFDIFFCQSAVRTCNTGDEMFVFFLLLSIVTLTNHIFFSRWSLSLKLNGPLTNTSSIYCISKCSISRHVSHKYHPCQNVIKAIGVFRQAIVLYETFDGRLILGKKCSQSKCELGCTRVIKCSFSYESP